jgi:hypothetical protein
MADFVTFCLGDTEVIPERTRNVLRHLSKLGHRTTDENAKVIAQFLHEQDIAKIDIHSGDRASADCVVEALRGQWHPRTYRLAIQIVDSSKLDHSGIGTPPPGDYIADYIREIASKSEGRFTIVVIPEASARNLAAAIVGFPRNPRTHDITRFSVDRNGQFLDFSSLTQARVLS